MKKKIAGLAAVLMVSSTATAVFAETETETEAAEQIACVQAEEDAEAAEVDEADMVNEDLEARSGTFGSLSYTVDGGVLTISGSGAMKDFTQNETAPWIIGSSDTETPVSKIVVKEGVTSIGAYAFANLDNANEITLPNSLTAIGENAFYGTKIASINIPYNVISLADGAFSNMEQLESITLNSGSNTFALSDGVLFNKSKTTLLKYPSAKAASSYVVPSTVMTVAPYAFNCASIVNVSFANPSTVIEAYAFEHSKVSSVALPARITEIKRNSFSFSFDLASVDIPSTLSKIGEQAFYDCRVLNNISIPSSVTIIEREAFGMCEGLSVLEILCNSDAVAEGVFDRVYPSHVHIPSGKKYKDYGFTSSQYRQYHEEDGTFSYHIFSVDANGKCGQASCPIEGLTSFTVSSLSDITAMYGQNTAVTVSVTGASNVTYNWQYMRNGESMWRNIKDDIYCTSQGADTATLTFTPLKSEDNIWNNALLKCVVTYNGATKETNYAKITIDSNTEIKYQPSNTFVLFGKTASFGVTLTETGNVSYIWQEYINGVWRNVQGVTNSNSYLNVSNVTTDMNGRKYRCAITSGNKTITTNEVTLTVYDYTTVPQSYVSGQMSKDDCIKMVNAISLSNSDYIYLTAGQLEAIKKVLNSGY